MRRLLTWGVIAGLCLGCTGELPSRSGSAEEAAHPLETDPGASVQQGWQPQPLDAALGFSLWRQGHDRRLEVRGPSGKRTYVLRRDAEQGTAISQGSPRPTSDARDPERPTSIKAVSVQTVSVPVRRVVTTSTAELAWLVALGAEDRLVGHDELDWIVDPGLRLRADAGQIREVGSGQNLDLERLLTLNPDLLLVDSLQRLPDGALGLLAKRKITVVETPSYLETSPLGQAEWLKLLAAFLSLESEAEAFFGPVAAQYRALADLGRAAETRPKVLTGVPHGDLWYVPAGGSFVARLLTDAGASYLWMDLEGSGTVPMELEAVWPRALQAELWLHPGLADNLGAIRQQDTRLGRLPPMRSGSVWSNDRLLGPQGGNDYWERGMVRPDLVLADLLAILHPDLLPDHQLVFHRRLPEPP